MSVTKLYHGSHRGMEGNIVAAASRYICDFGTGFYAGDNMTQAKMLIANDADSLAENREIYCLAPLSRISAEYGFLHTQGWDYVIDYLADRQ